MFRQLLRNSVLRRILAALGTLLGVAIFVFLMLRAIPGDQISSGLGTEAAALTPSQRAALEAYYGLDQPLFVQFFSWLGNIFTGNLGFSSRAQTSVLDLTAAALPVTFELAIFSIVIALAIASRSACSRRRSPTRSRDGFGQVVGLAGLSIPAFLLGTALLAVLASSFGFNPNGQAYATLF